MSAQATGVNQLKSTDAARYGTLNHPGDSYSYSIYEQAGAAIRRNAPRVLGRLHPRRVLALGESQSAIRLVTYIDAQRVNPPRCSGRTVIETPDPAAWFSISRITSPGVP